MYCSGYMVDNPSFMNYVIVNKKICGNFAWYLWTGQAV